MGAARVGVVLHPMLEQMLVPGKNGANVVGLEQRQVSRSQHEGRLLRTNAVGAGGERRMVAEEKNVDVALAVKALKLALHPHILFIIVGDVRVQSQNKGISIPKRIGGITGQAAGRAVGRDQRLDGIQVISQSRLALGRVGR